MAHGDSGGGDGSFRIAIGEDNVAGSNTAIGPRSSMEVREPGATKSVPPSQEVRAPETKLTLFALRLAVLEKAATGLGTLSFIWPTVVLLGGFASTLDKTDFWFITIVLLIEGTRIFNRRHELQWQRQSTRSLIAIRRKSQQGREIDDLWIFLSKYASKLLNWLQVVAAMASIALSSIKLIRHDSGDVENGEADKRNLKSALIIFYSLALAEALLFLLEKAYWELKVSYCKVLEDVSKECELDMKMGPEGLISVERFFYDAYSRCLNGSIFDGLKMDMVSFAIELLGSNSAEEELIGARILRKFATNERFSDDTLQKIGVNFSVIERLVEMLNWDSPRDEERQSAAEILSKLAGKKQNSLRVAGIHGAIESISSLLYTDRHPISTAVEIGDNYLGLLILKELALNHDNCGKISNVKGLLPRIIYFTHVEERILKDDNTSSQIHTVKISLQVLSTLASTTGATGMQLRQKISECVYTISNIRDILRYGEKHPTLQHLGIEILTSLALGDDATERIGGTGGILTELLKIFEGGMPNDQNRVNIAAGEALAMLALRSENNCRRILREGALKKLVNSLEVPLLLETAARILMNLCTYSAKDYFKNFEGVTAAVPTVLKGIMSEESELLEVMIGLAARALNFMAPKESSNMFEKAKITEKELCQRFVDILEKHRNPLSRIRRVRRFTIELVILMMRNSDTSKGHFKDFKLDKELEKVLDTTSEIESFNIVSGTVGLSRYQTSVHTLVKKALKLLPR